MVRFGREKSARVLRLGHRVSQFGLFLFYCTNVQIAQQFYARFYYLYDKLFQYILNRDYYRNFVFFYRCLTERSRHVLFLLVSTWLKRLDVFFGDLQNSVDYPICCCIFRGIFTFALLVFSCNVLCFFLTVARNVNLNIISSISGKEDA